MGIEEQVLQAWMVDENLPDLKIAVGDIIRAQIVILMSLPPSPSKPDWKEICKRYQVGAQAKQERPDPRDTIVIVNDKHKMAKQIVSILLEEEEPDDDEEDRDEDDLL